jgi:DNA-binding response OmpR family regulator
MKRVLLVHPENPAMSGLRQHLEQAGLVVVEADSRLLSPDSYPALQPDLLVLNFPAAWKAVEICAELRTRSQWWGVPVVLVGDALPETERILALESGASDYI